MQRYAFGKFMVRILLLCFAFLTPSRLQAETINPVEVFADGDYSNDAQLLINGYMPEQGTAFDGPECVYWSRPRVSFEIDLGGVFFVDGITMQADNNDNYIIEASIDGRHYSRMLLLSSQLGEIGWGMETVSTDRGSRHYLPGLRFIPARARYLRLSAYGGDRLYAVSEVKIFSGRPRHHFR